MQERHQAEAIGAQKALESAKIRVHQLSDDGVIPNNPKLPLLIYEGAVRTDRSTGFWEETLKKNHWGGCWLDGIYPYHHYHSTAHELLIVIRGSAQVHLGGERGIVTIVNPGDAVLIPAGVGHKNLGCSDDFEVMGAYPEGQTWDLCRGKPDERP